VAAWRRFCIQSGSRRDPDATQSADLETGLSGSVSVPPEFLGALISRQIDSDDVLSRLHVPVLVTHGRRDQIVLPSMAGHILRTCRTATPSWYDGAGHAPFIEDARRFNTELGDLVEQQAGPGHARTSPEGTAPETHRRPVRDCGAPFGTNSHRLPRECVRDAAVRPTL
jgi:hypothetical protein